MRITKRKSRLRRGICIAAAVVAAAVVLYWIGLHVYQTQTSPQRLRLEWNIDIPQTWKPLYGKVRSESSEASQAEVQQSLLGLMVWPQNEWPDSSHTLQWRVLSNPQDDRILYVIYDERAKRVYLLNLRSYASMLTAAG